MTSTPRRRVLVLGANGRFGQAAVQAFAAAGWQVLAQARSPLGPAMPAQALPIALSDTDALLQAAAGAELVVYAVNPPYVRWAREALPLARLGMDLAERLGAAFLLPGNVYAFGTGMPALLGESTPEAADTSKGRIRADMEAELRSRTRLRSVVLRAGDFFGAGHGTWIDQAIAKSLAAGKLVYPGPLDVPHAWAYLPDLARAAVAVAERGIGPGCTRLHFAGHTLTGTQLLDAIEAAAQRLGAVPSQGLRRGGMPWALVRIAELFVPAWRGLSEMSYLWRVPHALDGSALAAHVGALPATPLAAALDDTLRSLGFGRQASLTPAHS